MRQMILVPELRELLAADDRHTLKHFCDSTHPATVADLLSGLEGAEIWRILHLIDIAHRAEVFAHFELGQQVELATGENRQEMARLLEEMSPDERADLVQRLDESLRDEVLPLMAKVERENIRRLVSYAEGTAGSVMTTDYATLRPDVTVSQAIEQIRLQAPSRETVYYIYIVDQGHHLVGFVSLRDLIMAKPAQRVGDIMNREIITVGVNDDQEEVARRIEKYDLIAIPVIDAFNILVGIVTHDDAMDILRQEQQEDVEKFMAIAGQHQAGEYLRTSAWRHFRNRAGWAFGLAILGLVSGMIVQNYEGLLMQFAILAVFLPMLADTGGNTGSQSATLVVRALALREVTPRDGFRILGKELQVALMMGLLLGAAAYGRVVFLGGGSSLPDGFALPRIALAVGLALGLQVVSATAIGALLPLGAVRLKLDPAVVASPALTTIVDITGLLIYFGTARFVLGL